MTSSKIDKKEKESMLADVYGEVIFICIPFIALLAMNAIKSLSSDVNFFTTVFFSTDWSLISAVVFCQSAYKISRIIPKCGTRIEGRKYTLYLAIRFLYITFSMIVYGCMFFYPNIWLGFFQFLVFLGSLIVFIRDGLASAILDFRSKEN